ncbi:Hypothetical predicted protein [Podarcis lilfordi]|uniref:Uncharacterized protein n=1 Tax=Podarcis lilfordi TaxID=74358 RepID=A0AA35QR74_9SAUR|nr:Hypothetical predicted protein [Podarcis lilfordi]
MPGFQCPWRRQRIPVQCFRSKAVKAVETKQIQLKQLQKQVQEKRVQQKQLWALISVCETHVIEYQYMYQGFEIRPLKKPGKLPWECAT